MKQKEKGRGPENERRAEPFAGEEGEGPEDDTGIRGRGEKKNPMKIW